jgi:hypothetical protein
MKQKYLLGLTKSQINPRADPTKSVDRSNCKKGKYPTLGVRGKNSVSDIRNKLLICQIFRKNILETVK